MHHRLLLGSTALVGASVLFGGTALTSSSASAQTFVVKLSGYTEVGAVGATDGTLSSGPDRGYDFFIDSEVHIRADGETAGGTKYGSKVEFEAGEDASGNVDEVGLYFSGGFGRVELGDDDGAEDVMYVGGEDAQAGTGGIDGDIRNIAKVQFNDTSDATKATYFTPRLAGFQLGASYTPDTGNFGSGNGTDNNGDIANSIGAGVNWTGGFGPVDLTLSAVGLFGSGENNPNPPGGEAQDAQNWAVGGLFGFGGLTAGVGYNSEDDQGGEIKIFNAGLKYGFGPANVSVGYTWNDIDGEDDDPQLIVGSADYGLMPGVTVKADVGYQKEDPGKNDGDDQGSTWSGVLTVQLDY